MVHAPWRHGERVNYNGLQEGRFQIPLYAGNSEHPAVLVRVTSSSKGVAWSVTIRPVRTISRKPSVRVQVSRGSSETVRGTPTQSMVGEDTVRTSWRHEELSRNASATFEGYVPVFEGGNRYMPKVAKFLVG